MKKTFASLLILVMLLSLFTGCSGNTGTSEGASEEADNWKIGIMTGTVSQNEEEYRAAENVLKRFNEEYGEGHVELMTYPDKFMDEQETTIANVVSMASDPDMKAIIIVQAVPGTSAAIDKAKEVNPDCLFIAGVPGEDPAMIAEKADMVFALDELTMGKTMIDQAKAQGAKTFVHYSFPRHMSYALLAKRRDLLKENAEKAGMEFVDATCLDPTGDAGLAGAQQYILEDTPRMIEKYGKDTAFFSTNCGLQIPLIKSIAEGGAIYPQPCCPSPYHGFPAALGIKVPEDKKGDIAYVVDEISAELETYGQTGRMSTWPVPANMMFIEAGADYAVEYIEGNTDGRFDKEMIAKKFSKYIEKVNPGSAITLSELEDKGNTYENYLMVLLGYLDF